MSLIRFHAVILVASGLALASCSTFGGSSSGGTDSGSGVFHNLIYYGGTTVPPSITEEKEIECPEAVIRDGGAVLRNGKGQAVASQMTIRTVVRECAQDGQGLTVKVGVEGVAVIGTAGKAGTVSGPLAITVERDGKTLSSRMITAKTAIDADGNAIFSLVEEGIKIPPGDGDTTIKVGFKN